MSTLLIVYASSMGNTRRMAEAVAAGAKDIEGVEILLRTAEEALASEVKSCAALVLGSPVRHGNADSRLRYFIENDCEPLAFKGHLSGKLGAVFTVGAHPGRHGDGGEVAQLSLLRALAAAGMTLVTAPNENRNPFFAGPYWGPHARLRMQDNGSETLQPDMLALARAHGGRIAQLAQALRGQSLSAMMPPALRRPRVWHRLSAVFR
jgi:NAD(P)H dehydrogenase (quinone)